MSLDELIAALEETEALYKKCLEAKAGSSSWVVDEKHCPINDGCCPECSYFGSYDYMRDAFLKFKGEEVPVSQDKLITSFIEAALQAEEEADKYFDNQPIKTKKLTRISARRKSTTSSRPPPWTKLKRRNTNG
jgi:hypothetical protein